jgi:hypothetical protein
LIALDGEIKKAGSVALAFVVLGFVVCKFSNIESLKILCLVIECDD